MLMNEGQETNRTAGNTSHDEDMDTVVTMINQAGGKSRQTEIDLDP
jgi:hypothetical protein